MSLVMNLIPPIGPEQIHEGILELIKGFNSEGMTAAKEPGVGLPVWNIYQKILAEDKLNVRMFVLWDGGRSLPVAKRLIEQVTDFTKPYISTGDDHLISGGIKLYLDGSGGARTAWLYDDWSKDFTGTDTGNTGYPMFDPEVFREMVKIYHKAGLHIAVHAIGEAYLNGFR